MARFPLRSISLAFGLGMLAASVAPASGQVINGGFETGAFPPWTVSNTTQGGSVAQGVGGADIDGPGPLASSLAAYFIAGRFGASPTPEGVLVTQPAALTAGVVYDLALDWCSRSFVNSTGSAGIFEIVVNGQSIVQSTAPQAVANLQSYGHLAATYTPAATAVYTVGFRITRDAGAGEEIINYADNFILRTHCRADFNSSGAVTLQDLFDFLAAWFAHDPRADFNGSGSITIQDLFDFLAAWFAGC